MHRQDSDTHCPQAACSPEIQMLFLNNINGRKVVVWGTGALSEYFSPFIEKLSPISFYITRDAVDAFRGIRATTKEASALSPELHYVVVLASPCYTEIRKDLEGLGFVQYYSFFDLAGMYEQNYPCLSDFGVEPAKPRLKYRSCAQVENAMMAFQGSIDKEDKCIQPCCWAGFGSPPGIAFRGTPKETLMSFMLFRREMIAENIRFGLLGDAISDGKRKFTKACIECPRFVESDWPAQGEQPITMLQVAVYPSPCQCKCIYCNVRNDEGHGSFQYDESLHKKGYDRLFDTIEYALENGMISEDALLGLSPGEITIHPHRDKFLNLVKNRKTLFFINAFLFDEGIAAHLSSDPRSSICISIDCGTPETWRKIKGFDNFDTVISNVSKYLQMCQCPDQVLFKYVILLGINDNSKEYSACVDLLKKFKLTRLQVVPDYHRCFDTNANVQNDLCRAAGCLWALLRKNKIRTDMAPTWTRRQLEKIEVYAKDAY
jgi:wyosine [tRNA(Phe)-imidazoG37] synthetase (radical SAM superfamily)